MQALQKNLNNLAKCSTWTSEIQFAHLQMVRALMVLLRKQCVKSRSVARSSWKAECMCQEEQRRSKRKRRREALPPTISKQCLVACHLQNIIVAPVTDYAKATCDTADRCKVNKFSKSKVLFAAQKVVNCIQDTTIKHQKYSN